MALISTDDLVDYLGLGPTEAMNVDRLELFCVYASDFLIDQTGRDWVQTTRTGERYRGTGTHDLVLRHYPVASITSVAILDGASSTSLDVTDRTVLDLTNPEYGILTRTDGAVWPVSAYRNIQITYVGGPPRVPGYVSGAALDLAAWLYQQTGGRTSVSSPDLSVVLNGLAQGGLRELPSVKHAIALAGDVLY